jgi:hypothetical protein
MEMRLVARDNGGRESRLMPRREIQSRSIPRLALNRESVDKVLYRLLALISSSRIWLI